ncbi:hypothetical protein D9M71_676880 [compost metagenome]
MLWSSAREVSAISSRPPPAVPEARRRPSARSFTTVAIERMSASMARRTSIVTISDRPIDSRTRPAMVMPSERNSALAAAWASTLSFFSSAARFCKPLSSATNCFSAFCIELVAIDWSTWASSMVSLTILR